MVTLTALHVHPVSSAWSTPVHPFTPTMMMYNTSTRVQAPDSRRRTSTVAPRSSAPMTPGTQTPSRGGSRLIPGARPAPLSKLSMFDFRHTMRMGSWNVLSLAHPGYVEALTSVLEQYRLKLVSLSETRITGCDELLCGDYTILNSGGTQHHRGVALVLQVNPEFTDLMAACLR